MGVERERAVEVNPVREGEGSRGQSSQRGRGQSMSIQRERTVYPGGRVQSIQSTTTRGLCSRVKGGE